MPITDHPVCLRDFSDSTKLWRYMDFLKFYSMVENSTLYFPSAELLSADDPFEGSTTAITKRFKRIAVFNSPDQKPVDLGAAPDEVHVIDLESAAGSCYQAMSDGWAQMQRSMRLCTYINSWHMNEYESTAMWKLYAQKEYGIAVVSDLKRLTRSLQHCEHTIYLGRVKYIDYDSDCIPEGNFLEPFLFKTKSLSHENEVRALITPPEFVKELPDAVKSQPHVLAAQCNIGELVEAVVVSPNSPRWIYDLVKKYVEEKLERPVQQSRILSEPYFG